ncbi:HAD family hydrolase [Pedobacter steynii]|uniref:Haloacid dehalogenase n=1 Tax=Pedobacter steynii TaxID=430522 RepID=A0A1D7QJ10_9SPHI|nr:HAD hydrolase-like protein [Pedobacter steynii]AOM78651.1 haloacid dehalogenase [Pedobacter steynii]
MVPEKYLQEKQAFVFELDDVLYPEKDYLLQVYYLFAQFIEYGEQLNATEILQFMQEKYLSDGHEGLFEQTAAKFDIPLKYQLNFDLLLQNARLPLKLLVFNKALTFLQEIVARGKQLFLFVDGDPVMQLNKIRQIEWNGLENHLVVYFAAEIQAKPAAAGLELIMDKHTLKQEDILFVGKEGLDRECASNAKIDFLEVNKLLSV